MCHHLQDAGNHFEAGDKVVIVIINDIDSVDGCCAGIICGDVVGGGDRRWFGMVLLGVVWVMELMLGVVVAFVGELKCLSSGSSICRAAH